MNREKLITNLKMFSGQFVQEHFIICSQYIYDYKNDLFVSCDILDILLSQYEFHIL